MSDWEVDLLGPGAGFAAGAVETLAENHRTVKQETSDNEALYCRLRPAAPSHSFSLQWLIHRVLHCVMASRCEGEYNTLWQVAAIFAASISLYCMDTAGLDLERLCLGLRQHSMQWLAPPLVLSLLLL